MPSVPATSQSGTGGLRILGRKYGSRYGMLVGRRRVRV
jgi:hypothetical protein